MLYRNIFVIILGPVIILAVHAVGVLHSFYANLLYFDSAMHFAGGCVAALSLGGVLWHGIRAGKIAIQRSIVLQALVVGVVALLAVGWEVLEVNLGMEPNWKSSVSDTVRDQVWGVTGAVVGALFIKL
jgi:hypothetical protein